MPINLIGTGLDQVPVNGMLGDLAFQNKESVEFSGGKGALSALTIKEISNSKNITAVDVFVYDTSKDSDGGAWRKRTQNTSWYNEELNTATRGSRREFPSVAVMTATATSVTIYDGDSPDLPMWMVFTGGSQGMGSTFLLQNGNSFTIAAINATLVVGLNSNNDNYGSPIINFISEKVVRMDPQTTEGGTWLGTIAERNSTKGYASYTASGGGYIIANSIINDVAVIVLPNAPVDLTTGLPVPTIAVATNSGISVIHNNGTVNTINATDSVEYNYWRTVEFTKDYKLIINGTYAGVANNIVHVCDIPYTNFSGAVVNQRITALNSRYYHSDSSIPNFKPGIELGKTASIGINTFAIGGTGNVGFNLVAEAPETASGINSSAMIAYVAPTYNTGWMTGNIKGAWLSDTSTVTASSNAILTEDFSAQGNWGLADGPTISGGVLTLANQTSSRATLPSWNGISGNRYLGIINISSNAASGIFALDDDGAGAGVGGATNYRSFSGTGVIYFYFTKTASNRFRFIRNSGGPISITSFYVYEVEADRSVIGNDMQVFGTINKQPVATGADLVAYSNISNINYLQATGLPNVGTGDFCLSYWSWHAGDSSDIVIGAFGFGLAGVSGLYIANNYVGDFYVIQWVNSAWSNYVSFNAPTLPNNTWHNVVVNRVNGTIKLYVDGIYRGDRSFPYNLDASHTFTVTSNTASGQRMSLVRYGFTPMTQAQITKAYNEEKMLFQDNAKAVLYGTSAAVNALAYDDETRLLHVGTSSGRSVFNGLRRIDNTTTAVARAISAAGGLVAED